MRLIATLCLLILCSCGRGPGAPPLVDGSSRGFQVVPGCQTVHPNVVDATFTTGFYLTTWGSAISEGARAGVRDGVGSQPEGAGLIIAAALSDSISIGGDELVPKRTASEPFCMVVNSPMSTVRRAQTETFRELRTFGYRQIRSRTSDGLFQTSFVKLEHSSAKWYDRYSSSLLPISSSKTVVFVYREVFISRYGDPYFQGESVGQNETWILSRIRDRSAGRPG